MLNLNNKIIDLVNKEEKELTKFFKKINNLSLINSKKVLDAFHKYQISESDFNSSSGYGYNDIGRDKIEKVYSDIFGSEDALVRNQIISGSHAITTALFGVLRPNDNMICITGLPYDTIHEVIGIKENESSLKSFGIKYKELDLLDNDFNYNEIEKNIKNNKIKLIYIQRSKGYTTRESICIDKIEKVCKFIKSLDNNIIIFVDNCYCEFVEEKSPIEAGADLCAGSLIKNLGGGIANNGGYICGKEKLIKLCAERLNLPGEGKDVGPSQNANRMFLQGLYFAPSVVASALKVAILTSKVLETLGYNVIPKFNDNRADIVQLIEFNTKEELINYATMIQSSGAIDSQAAVVPSDMPGYDNKIIMASPSFVQGSSIELSCDAPIKEPYVLFQQGSITYDYGKLALINALSKIKE